MERFDGLSICRRCWLQIEPWNDICCERCGLPIVSSFTAESTSILCSQCRLGELSYDGARAFGIYRGNLKAAILQLKFRRRERLGRRLGSFLANTWNKVTALGAAENALVVPVPLYPSRERARGFNQAGVLARGLMSAVRKGRRAGPPKLAAGVLVRIRPTRPQTGLNFRARRENVRGAFKVRKPGRVLERNIVLVDDVMTTGATISACAEALKRAGSSRVYAVVLARATSQFSDVHDLSASNIDEFRWDWT